MLQTTLEKLEENALRHPVYQAVADSRLMNSEDDLDQILEEGRINEELHSNDLMETLREVS